jgi:PEP-CTERM motif
MKKLLASTVTAVVVTFIVPAARAGIIYSASFGGDNTNLAGSGLATSGLDVDNNGGSNTWVASTGYKKNGTTPSASINSGAYLPFTPVAGNTYTLSARFLGVGPDGTNVAWHGLGFGKGMPTTNMETGDNRFISGATAGRAWLLFRPNNPLTPTDSPNVNHLGNTTSGTASNPTWTDATLARAEGGDIDMEIILNTVGAIWTADFLAKRPTDSSYTDVSGGPLNLIAQDIGSVGIARTTNSGTGALTGTVASFVLSVEPVPEPASIVLVALGLIAIGVPARRK